MKRRIMTGVVAMVMAVSLAGCGGTSDMQQTSQPVEGQSGQSSKTGTEKSLESSVDSVTVACAAEPDCFYPYHKEKTTNMDEVPILHNVYESLIKLGPDNERLPLLATEWEQSEDSLSYTLKLRDDVNFSNGDHMTAEDVKFSLDSAVEVSAGKSMLANYESTEILDDYTIKINLTAPYAAFLNTLASRYALVVNKALFEEIGQDAYDAAPVGTGPYKFVERVSGDHISLVANEDYWGGAPSIKNVNFAVMSDTNTQLISLENGDIDVLINGSPSILQNLKSDKIKYEMKDASTIDNFRFNCAKGPASDINFRKAVQCGINREDINIGVYNGLATVGDMPAAPGFSGRPDEGTYKAIVYDPEKAKEYLEASNYNGEEFSIICVSGTKDETAAQIIQGQLMEIGINCTVNAVDSSSYSALGDQSGEYGARLRFGGVSALDADGGFYFQYHSASVAKGGANFASMAYSDELDAKIMEGREESDADKRKEIYAECTDILNENVYGITIYYDINACAYNVNLSGVTPRSLSGLYYFNDWNWK